MSKKKKNIPLRILIVLVVLAAGGYAGWNIYIQKEHAVQTASLAAYKEETVRKGTVATGVSESGTVSFSTVEQNFAVAEVTEVSTSTSSASSTGSQSSSGGMSAGGMSSSMGGMSGGSSMTTTSTSDSSGEATSLEVEEVYVASGQVVQEGDKILKISEESIAEYRAQLENAVEDASLQVTQEEINVESKKSEADYTYQMYLAEGKTAEETYNATITSLENDVAELEEELAEAAEEVAELQEELDDGEDVEEDLEEAELNYSSIESELQIAKNNLATKSIEAKQTYENAMTNYKYADQLYEIDTNGLEDDLNDAKETLEEAEANLEEFESQIGDGIVYAEYSGTITAVSYAAGDTITNDATIATYIDAGDVNMTVSVSQEDISQVTVGDTVSITLAAYSGETFEGEVTEISTSSSGSSTVNYEVTSRFTGNVEKLYSGMTGEVTFDGKKVEDTLYISNRAVHQEGTRIWVKVLQDDGTIVETDIKTGFSNGTIVAVESGLEEGQTVLIESQVTQ